MLVQKSKFADGQICQDLAQMCIQSAVSVFAVALRCHVTKFVFRARDHESVMDLPFLDWKAEFH